MSAVDVLSLQYIRRIRLAYGETLGTMPGMSEAGGNNDDNGEQQPPKGSPRAYQVGKYDKMMDVVRRAHGEDEKKKRLEAQPNDGFERPQTHALSTPAVTAFGGSKLPARQTPKGPFGRRSVSQQRRFQMSSTAAPHSPMTPGPATRRAPIKSSDPSIGQQHMFRSPLWMVRHVVDSRALLHKAAAQSPLHNTGAAFDMRGDGSRIPRQGEVTVANFSYNEHTSQFYKLAEGATSEAGEGAEFIDPEATKTHVAVPLFSDPGVSRKK